MVKFKLLVETRQIWTQEIEAEDFETARTKRDELYELIQETYMTDLEKKIQADEPLIILDECFGGDDLSDEDIEIDLGALKVADYALHHQYHTLELTCPNCGNTLIFKEDDDGYSRIYNDINNKGFSIVECSCGKSFMQKEII